MNIDLLLTEIDLPRQKSEKILLNEPPTEYVGGQPKDEYLYIAMNRKMKILEVFFLL